MKHLLQAQLFKIILESNYRVNRLQIDKIVDSLKIEPGTIIADIGCGTGLFSRSFARAVQPEGTVYAVDTNPWLIKKLSRSVNGNGIGNIKAVLASDEDYKLPERADLIFMCDVLHHVEDKVSFLRNVPRYLKQDGKLALIDFSDKWPAFHKAMRFTPQQCEKWTEQAGLELVDRHDFLRETIGSFFNIYRLQKS